MSSDTRSRSPSSSQATHPLLAARRSSSPTSSAPAPVPVANSSVPAPQTSAQTQASNPVRQNTLPTPQPPRRISTTQTYQTTSTSLPNHSIQALSPQGSRPSAYFQRLYSAFSPSTHDIKQHDGAPQDTSRPYDHRQQRKRLWLKTVVEFAITFILCLSYWLILYLYHRDDAIDTVHRRIFNSLVTGNALFLGINLQASLKSYIKMLRWNILASRYRPLKIFDLILGSDSVTNVVKLVWHGRNKRHPFAINIFTSTTSLLALTWLLIQLGIAVCVGLIGLTYNLDVNIYSVNTQTGNTSSINLSTLSNPSWLTTLAEINTYGIKGDFNPGSPSPSLSYDDISLGNYLWNDQGQTRYFFTDFNPNDKTINEITRRYIDSSANCTRSVVTYGQYGLSTQITYSDANGRSVNESLFEAPGEGGVYAVADTNSTCGDRCTNIKVLQAGVSPANTDSYALLYGSDRPEGTWFSCDITVSDVQSKYYYSNFSQYQISPQISRMLAGAYGWSSNPLRNNRYLYETYGVASELALSSVPSVDQMKLQLTAFAMDGIQAMDVPDTGLNRMFVSDGYQPVQAQILSVKWWALYTLLGAIPLVQFVTWIAVIATANRVIIKDDSPLSMAKVYWTLLRDTLGQHGCMLDNDQLISEVGKTKVVYGYTEETGGNVTKHVDIFEEGKGCEPARSFPQGDYDGPGDLRKRVKRDLNAHEYF